MNILYPAALVALLSISVALSYVFLHFTVDDAFISFRYAKNLVEGFGWLWNPSASPVEAYTSFSYAILAIIPHWLDIPSNAFFKVLGGVFIGLIVYRVLHHFKNKVIALLVLVFVLANPATYVHAFSGLETPMFMWLLVEVYFLLRVIAQEQKLSARGMKYLYVLLLLLPLTRPEGALFSMLAFFYLLFQARALPEKKFFIVVALVGVGYFLIRYNYFGYILPNTVYAKKGGGIEDVFDYNFSSGKSYLIMLTVLAFFTKGVYRFVALVSIFSAGCYLSMNLAMNYADRFFYQIALPGFVFSMHYFDRPAHQKRDLVLLIIIFLGTLSIIDRGFRKTSYTKLYTYNLFHVYGAYGKILSKYKEMNFTLLTGDAGISPYYSGWKVVDYLGLADDVIAHNGLTAEYLKLQSPDLVTIYSKVEGEPVGISDYAISPDTQSFIVGFMEESGDYQYLTSFKAQHYYMASYVKNTIPMALRQELLLHAESSKKAKPSMEHLFAGRYLNLIAIENN